MEMASTISPKKPTWGADGKAMIKAPTTAPAEMYASPLLRLALTDLLISSPAA
jgi:hypothetical protein